MKANVTFLFVLLFTLVLVALAWHLVPQPRTAAGLLRCARCGETVESWKVNHQPVPYGCQEIRL